MEEAAFVLAAGRDAGINATASCGGTRPLTETPAWRLFVEPVNLSRPCRPTQSNDQWRNSGGASGATELLTEDGAIVVRRYGAQPTLDLLSNEFRILTCALPCASQAWCGGGLRGISYATTSTPSRSRVRLTCGCSIPCQGAARARLFRLAAV